MDFGIYTSFNGRINRAKYWLASIILVVVFIALLLIGTVFVVGIFRGEFTYRVWLSADDPLVFLMNFVLKLLVLYPWAALTVKRLHDRNRSGYFAAFILVPSIILAITDILGITGSETFNWIDGVLGGLLLVVTIWFFIELGCLRGTVGKNQYGADPLAENA